MGFEANVDGIHAKICELGFRDTRSLKLALNCDIFPYDQLNQPFKLDTSLPQIVSVKKYEEHPTEQWYSGNINIKKYIERFQKGHMKTVEEHKNGYRHGLGYYFSVGYKTALEFTKASVKGGVMAAKPVSYNRFVLLGELRKLLSTNFPRGFGHGASKISPDDDFDTKKKLMHTLFCSNYCPQLKTTSALLFGYDGITVDLKEFACLNVPSLSETAKESFFKLTRYVVGRRSGIMQLENPIVQI